MYYDYFTAIVAVVKSHGRACDRVQGVCVLGANPEIIRVRVRVRVRVGHRVRVLTFKSFFLRRTRWDGDGRLMPDFSQLYRNLSGGDANIILAISRKFRSTFRPTAVTT